MFSRLVEHFTPRAPRVVRAPGAEAEIVLRLATTEDERAVERLAALYDRPAPEGPLLLAEVDGELLAALALTGDRELMEPFRPTAGLVELLALRAKHLAAHAVSRSRRPGCDEAAAAPVAAPRARHSPGHPCRPKTAGVP